jgi:HEAT repeat protein
MAQPQQICLACFGMIDAAAAVCPRCGADLAALSGRAFGSKLVGALQHPLSEVRMRAVIALGWRGDPQAAAELERLAWRHPADVIEGLAVVDALAQLDSAGQASLAVLAASHPAHAIRAAAHAALARSRKENSR